LVQSVGEDDERRALNDIESWPECLKTHGLMIRPAQVNVEGVVSAEGKQQIAKCPLLGAKVWQWLDKHIASFLCEEEDGRMKVYTDGACSDPGSIRHARAGYGVYYYPKCPWNVALPLGGKYQGSDRAELKAALTAAEVDWGDWLIVSDNTSVVDGIAEWKAFHAGEGNRPKNKANPDLWKRFGSLLGRKEGTVSLVARWTKGHATDEMVEKGAVAQEDKVGNDEADKRAVHGRRKHGDCGSTAKDASIRRKLTMMVQRMAINILARRSNLRKEMEIDEQDEEECENRKQECDTSGRPKSLDEIFPPREAGPGGENGIEKMRHRFPNAAWRNPEGQAAAKKLGPIPSNIKNGTTRWNYPSDWVVPLKWYWEGLEFVKREDDTSKLGVTWIELAIDFELATRVMLNGGNWKMKVQQQRRCQDGKGDTTVTQRAFNFAAASRRLFAICGAGSLPRTASIGTLQPFGARSLAGLPARPKLLQPLEVAKELAIQAITYSKAFDVGADTRTHWKWNPRYVSMPAPLWHGRSVALGLGAKPRRRLLRKRPAWLLEETLSRGAKKGEAPGSGLGEQGNLPQPKRRRVRGKTCQENAHSVGAVCGAAQVGAEEANPPQPKRRRIRGKTCHEDVGEIAARFNNLSIMGRVDRVSINLPGVRRQGETRA
jgi:ribonuclease HI